MRKLTFAIVLTTASAMVQPAAAQGAAEMGAGVTSCAKYNQLRSADPAAEIVYYTWAQGYLSRLNNYETQLAGLARVDLMPSGFGPQKQMNWLNAYCVTHTADTYSTGVFELYKYIRALNGYTS